MSETIAPVDERLSRYGIYVPLPITPIAPRSFPSKTDGHHAVFPAEAPELEHIDYNLQPSALNPRSLRWARVQQGNRLMHNNFYHAHFDRVPFPRDEHEYFKTMLFLVTGFVPDHVVDPVASEPQIVPLTEEMRSLFHDEHLLNVQRKRRWGVGLTSAIT